MFLSCSHERVQRFSPEQLQGKALQALEEVCARAKDAPVEPTPELRFTLAYLANEAAERWPFDYFWKEATGHGSGLATGRLQSLNASLNGIYLQVGVRRQI
jgi:hypothetical protein